jgi:hypothetical protein
MISRTVLIDAQPRCDGHHEMLDFPGKPARGRLHTPRGEKWNLLTRTSLPPPALGECRGRGIKLVAELQASFLQGVARCESEPRASA